MIIDHRTYNILPGKLPEFLKIYKELGLDVQRENLGNLVGYYVSMDIGELNQIIHLWGYESLEDRSKRRAELAKSKKWQEFLKNALPLLSKMENKILTPTDFSPS